MKMRLLTFLASVTCVAAYSPSVSRRQAFQTFTAGAVLGVPALANALDACSPKANNCVFTKWTPPAGASKSAAIKDLRAAIEAYPQEGQAEVDGGGWSIASDDLDSAGTARIEYRSSGKGFFAKSFNGGKPFVDDLNVEVDSNGMVQVRSASRVGDSDFGVNAKRAKYLAASLQGKGWSVEGL